MPSILKRISVAMVLSLLAVAHAKADDGTYLIVPFVGLQPDTQRQFLYEVMPYLTLHGPLTNTGTSKAPWYCVAVQSEAQAQTLKRTIGDLLGAYELESKIMIDQTCAAG